jgi:hypothetical protein
MPGEEEEDIIMTSTQANILNFSCPVSGKPITELEEPVRRYCMNHSKYCCFCLGCFLFYINS